MASVILTCPSCQSRYQVELDELMPAGRRVQCSHCAHVWSEEPPTRQEPPGGGREAPEASSGAVPPAVSQTEPPADSAAAEPAHAATADRDEAPEPPEDDPDFAVLAEELRAIRARSDPRRAEPSVAGGRDTPAAAPLHVEREHAAPHPEQRPDIAGTRPPAAGGARSSSSRMLFAAAALVIVLANLMWFGREQLVAVYPSAADAYALFGIAAEPGAGLTIEIDPPRYVNEDGTAYLVVGGRIVNASERPRRVPELIGVLSNSQAETVLQWSFAAAEAQVAPGQSVAFASRVADPPDDTKCLNFYFLAPEQNIPCKGP